MILFGLYTFQSHNYGNSFLARDSIITVYAWRACYMLSQYHPSVLSACHSVCRSVCHRVDQSKTVGHIRWKWSRRR